MYLHRSTLHFLDTNKVKREVFVQMHHSINHHLGEELVVAANQFRIDGCTSTSLQHRSHLTAHWVMRTAVAVINATNRRQGGERRTNAAESLEPESRVMASSLILALANSQAARKPRTMILGWTPSSTKLLDSLSSSPAKMTTLVVPSPT